VVLGSRQKACTEKRREEVDSYEIHLPAQLLLWFYWDSVEKKDVEKISGPDY
jgi:hypothetical protein